MPLRKADAGKHGRPIGILMLDTRFPRPPGDIGNPATFDFPVVHRTVAGARPQDAVTRDPSALLAPFIAAARELEADGVAALSTSCGFLSLFQAELAASVSIPVATSALLQIAPVNRLLGPHKRCGVLTISGSSLTEEHLAAVGAPLDTPVGTTEGGGVFSRTILDDEPELDPVAARRENIAAAEALCARHGDIGAIVLECTNMGPYAAGIAERTGLPVYSIVTLLDDLHAAITPRDFG